MTPLIKQFEHLQIQLEDIKSATNNFADNTCIGKGGFGNVYKGELILSEGRTMVAIKRLNRAFGQGDPEFWKEVIMLSLYKHENIVSLLGFCDDSGEKILVYEYASRRSLDLYLNSNDLSWVRRLEICIGAARGLAHLHTSVGTQQRVLHRDIKSSNILLDENWNARISDLGLSKFGPANQQYTFLVSNAVGTIGYCDPLYVETGLLTKESDVYSFGVVLFEMLCGRLCIRNDKDKRRPLTGLVRQFYEQNKIDEIIYDNIKDEVNTDSLQAFTTIAYRCLSREREGRPSMTEVVDVIQSALEYQEIMKHEEQKSTHDTPAYIRLHHIRAGRQRFGMEELLQSKAEVLGTGSLATSYKIEDVSQGLVVVVKRFRSGTIGAQKLDFHAHMMMLGSLSHPNLLPYVACYYNKDEKLLITDFVGGGSLASRLDHDTSAYRRALNSSRQGLDWPARLKILQGVASGLHHLYQEFPHLTLPHGNLKSSSVLLDHASNPFLADYAFFPIFNEEHTQQHMAAYNSPEFKELKMITRKTDVWCLGILILEMMTGLFPKDYGGDQDLEIWVNSKGKEEWIDQVFDKDMKWAKNNEIEMIDLLEIGLHCCESDIKRRWNMRKAIDKIKGLKEGEDDEEDSYDISDTQSRPSGYEDSYDTST